MATTIYIVVSLLVILGLVIFIASKLVKKDTSVLTTPEDHKLVRTWIGNSGITVAGWMWKCSCGTQGVAGNADNEGSLGSESNAIACFRTHASLYRDVNGNEWKDRYFELQNVFDKFRDKCYCKDTNTDLKALEDDLKYGSLRDVYINKKELL